VLKQTTFFYFYRKLTKTLKGGEALGERRGEARQAESEGGEEARKDGSQSSFGRKHLRHFSHDDATL
jgi:hypothetical protein